MLSIISLSAGLGDLFTDGNDGCPTVVIFYCLLSLSVGLGDLFTNNRPTDCLPTVVRFYCPLSLSVGLGDLFTDNTDCWPTVIRFYFYCSFLWVLVIYPLNILAVGLLCVVICYSLLLLSLRLCDLSTDNADLWLTVW